MKQGLQATLHQLDELGKDLAKDKPLVDLKGVIPLKDHHQTAVFVRLPYEGALNNEKVHERVFKFLSSINRPDTIKADVYTLLGANIMPGYQPHISHAEAGKAPLFNTDWVLTKIDSPYVIQITVDLVWPAVLEAAANQAKAEQ